MARLTLYLVTFLALAGGCCPLFASTAPGTPPNVTVIYNTPTVTPTLVALNATTCGGGEIAFVGKDGDSNPQLYVMDADGSDLRTLTSMTYGISPYSEITWSPDGQQIAFVAGNIYIINSDGSGLHKLTHVNYILNDPAWSPDGKKVAFSASGTAAADIFTINSDGSNMRQITYGTQPNFYMEKTDPLWSLDGKQIVYSSREFLANGQVIFPIDMMNADGSGEQSLAQDVGASSKVWSPDGNTIIFSYYSAAIDVFNLHDHSYQTLIRDATNPSFSPNGRCLLFESRTHLYLALPDGSNIQPLLNRVPSSLDVESPVLGR